MVISVLKLLSILHFGTVARELLRVGVACARLLFACLRPPFSLRRRPLPIRHVEYVQMHDARPRPTLLLQIHLMYRFHQLFCLKGLLISPMCYKNVAPCFA